MPLPLIAAGVVIVGSLGAGGSAGGVGLHRRSKAKKLQADVETRVARERRLFGRAHSACEAAGVRLGERKVDVMNGAMRALHDELSRFRHLEFDETVMDELPPDARFDFKGFEQIDFEEWERLAVGSMAAAGALAKAAGTGAAASGAAVALGAAGATASTGTAIGTLSGAAATNATLAWFGGGSLAAGGGGMAAGAMVMSGFAAAPAVLVGGGVLLHSGSKMLERAETNVAKADAAIAKSRAARTVLDAMTKRADGYEQLIARLSDVLRGLLPGVRAAADRETDARRLTNAEKELVRTAFRVGVVIGELVNERLMWRGSLTKKSQKTLERGRRFLDGLGS